MPVFDFSNDTTGKQEEAVCTYTTFSSNEDHATIKCPILILSNKRKDWAHHSCGFFQIRTNKLPLNLKKMGRSFLISYELMHDS